MERTNHTYLINKGILVIATVLCVNSQMYAEESLGSAIDCSEAVINYIDRPDMTRRESLEAMNSAFYESVNRFELCNLSNQSSASLESTSAAKPASSTGSEAGMSGTEGSASDLESGIESQASPLMTGTETESTLSPSDYPEDSGMPENADDEAVAIYTGNGGNGAVPEDIPAANNDDAVAAQIRLAAEIETDPVKKEKLWNEYRRYRGLPAKDNER